jgi:phosphoadenosine phosphosulfate reductase
MNLSWCPSCNVPIIGKDECSCGSSTKYLSTDARPVFPQERYLLYLLTGNQDYLSKSVWAGRGYRFFLDGVVVKESLNDLMNEAPLDAIRSSLMSVCLDHMYEGFEAEIERLVQENREHIQQLEYAAEHAIRDAVEKHHNFLPVVSFSGGKDSTVVSGLVSRALSNPSILHLFSDTTLEFPLTIEYIRKFREKYNKTPFITSRSNHDFMSLCEEIGPPSRVISWCCTVFKTGPLNTKINGFAKNTRLLTFYGIRAAESTSRSDYQSDYFEDYMGFHKVADVAKSPKIAKQKVVSPIFDWLDIDIWLYIFYRKLEFNDSYRLGFPRVGCWCCPNNGAWSMFLASIYMEEESTKWRSFLVDFARRIGKPDPEEYVDSGNWKARQGGAGLDSEQINIEAKQCVDEVHSRTIILTRPISDELYEYFRPFGIVNRDLGNKFLNEVVILDRRTKKQVMKLQGLPSTYELKVSVISPSNYRLISQRIDCQLRKYQSCIGCLGCASVCPRGAITYIDGHYRISEEKCVGCLDCINPWGRGGCLMAKVLAVKKGAS